MQSVTATIRNGQVETNVPIDWPDGTSVEIVPLVAEPNGKPPMTEWPAGYFDRLRKDWGDEPFERPPQGVLEVREDW